MSDNETNGGPKKTTPAATRSQAEGHGKKQPKPGQRKGQKVVDESNPAVDLHPGDETEGGATAVKPTEDQKAKVNAKEKPNVEQPEELGSGDEVAPIGTVLLDIPAEEGPDSTAGDPSNLQVTVSDEA